MSRSKVLLLATFVLVLSAGVVVGRLWTRLPDVAAGPGKERSWLNDQLGLTPDQQQKMDAIWAETRQKIDVLQRRRSAEQKERDQAVRALLTEEQRAAYDKILEEYRGKRSEADKEREALVRDAADHSRALLNDEQKKRWEAMRAEPRKWHGPSGGGGGPTHPHGPSTESSGGSTPLSATSTSGTGDGATVAPDAQAIHNQGRVSH